MTTTQISPVPYYGQMVTIQSPPPVSSHVMGKRDPYSNAERTTLRDNFSRLSQVVTPSTKTLKQPMNTRTVHNAVTTLVRWAYQEDRTAKDLNEILTTLTNASFIYKVAVQPNAVNGVDAFTVYTEEDVLKAPEENSVMINSWHLPAEESLYQRPRHALSAPTTKQEMVCLND